jgi:hypothetical protein
MDIDDILFPPRPPRIIPELPVLPDEADTTRILQISTNRRFPVKEVVERKGIKSNPNNFQIPYNNVIVKINSTYRITTPQEAQRLLQSKQIRLCDIYGKYNFNGDFVIEKTVSNTENQTIKKPTMSINQIKLGQSRQLNEVIRYALKPQDKRNPFMFRDFLGQYDIKGEGKFLVAQNGRVIFEEIFDVGENSRKWFNKNGNVFIGMVDSDSHVWSFIDSTIESKQVLHTPYHMEIIKKQGSYRNNYSYVLKDTASNADIDNFNQTQTVFYWSPYRRIQSNRIYQTFRASITNTCFFDVIEKYLLEKIESVKNPSHYKASLNKLNKYKEIYSSGCPEEVIQDIANDIKMNFTINDVFNGDFIDIKCDSKSQTTIKYINSMFDHVDKNDFVDNSNNQIPLHQQSEMYEIVDSKINNSEPFYYAGTLKNLTKIYTQEGTYVYECHLNQIIKDFNDKIKIYDFAIDYLKNKDLWAFIHQGTIYSAHCIFSNKQSYTDEEIESNPDFIEYDMVAAYTQYKQSTYYQGFPTIMTQEMTLSDDFDIKKFVGYYRILITGFSNSNVKLILSDMGITEGCEYVLPSPELLLYRDNGVEFKIISGSFCFKTFHIEMTDEMLTKVDQSKPYAIWAGRLNSHINEYESIKTITTKKLAEQISDKYGVYVSDSPFEDKVECMKKTLKSNIQSLCHIGGFITSYTRTNMLQKIFTINHDLLIGYKLDGFIKKRDSSDINLKVGDLVDKIFKIKPTKSTFNWGEKIFINIQEPYNDISSILTNNLKSVKELSQERISILLGQGGSGKTHNILSKFPDCMYIASSWKLITEKIKEYDCKGMTYHQLLGIGCDSYLDKHRPPKRILLDEITQLDISIIDMLIEKAPYSQIFLAGDVDEHGYYQCEFKDVKVLNINAFKQKYKCSLITFTKNYRCKDPELQKILLQTRDIMRESNFDTTKITNHIKKVFEKQFIKVKDLKKMYCYKSDWVLVSITNGSDSQTAYYTNLLKGNKYLCVSHRPSDVSNSLFNPEKQTYLIGYIVIDPPQAEKTSTRFQQRDAFTIHSFQGITIRSPQKLFIDINDIFCPRQLYTAISRVEYLNQIYFIN